MNLSQFQQQNGIALLVEAAGFLGVCAKTNGVDHACDVCGCETVDCPYREEAELKERIADYLSEIK